MTADRPWWQTTKTPRQGFILGACYAVLGIVEVVATLAFGGHVWFVLLGSLFLVLAAAYLGPAAALHRRRRSASGIGRPADPPLRP